MTEREFKQLLSIHDTEWPVPERPAYRLLQDTAYEHPDRVAVVACDRTLTYAELNAEANAVARALVKAGASADAKVAVLADRDGWAYTMRMAPLKAGAAFMPVDPEYPEERVRYILEDSGCKLVLTTQAIHERRADLFDALADLDLSVIEVESAVAANDTSDLNLDVAPHDLAYVIYTSGSTGKPKGVMLENHNLVNFCHVNPKNIEAVFFTEGFHACLALAAFTFDVSVMEQFLPLANGMTVVLATQEQIMDPDAMARLIERNNVETFTCTPSYLSNMIEVPVFAKAMEQIDAVDVGAEAFPGDLYTRLKAINPNMRIMNSYGPTECTIGSTAAILEGPDDITIGVPYANYHCITVNEEGEPLPIGTQGELVILGDGVGRGYIGRDDLNERNFITLFGIPAYRAGDLAVVRPDGNIEFHGRVDDQVKLRGLRVELGEVEKVIGGFPGVKQAVVTVVKGAQEYLAAHFLADKPIDIPELKRHAKQYLTSYMVPQSFMQMEEFPLTPNGKVDKRALPEAELDYSDIVPAKTDVQKQLLDIVFGILKTDRVGITSDLLEAGLSSLGAIRLCSEIRAAFNVAIKTSELADNSTVEDLERLIGAAGPTRTYELRDEYPLSQTQTGILIEVLRHPGTTMYNLPELYTLDASVDVEKLADAVRAAIAVHPYLFMTVRRDAEGKLHAVRRDGHPFEVQVIRCESLPTEDELVRPFDLMSGELLFRAEIYVTDDGSYLLFDTHHIVSDGGSIDILMEDVERAFQGETLQAEEYTGFEFALDEEEARATDRLDAAKAFYDGYFRGCGGETMPVRDGDESAGHVAMERLHGKADGAAVRAFCDEHGLPLNAFFTAAFAFALKEYADAEVPVFTTIYNGRNDPRLANSVSMLVKTLPVSLDCKDDDYVMSLVETCKSYLTAAMANDLYSFAEIHQAYGVDGNMMFVYQGEFEHGFPLGGKNAPVKQLGLSRARAAFALDLSLDGDELVFEPEYDPTVFSPYTVHGMVNLIDHVVNEFVAKDRLRDVTLVSAEDEERIRSLHDTDWPVAERPAYRLLQDQAEDRPDAVALVACDRTLTYGELNGLANAVGHALVNAGAAPNSMVAVMAERDSWAYVMRQAALKAGAAFLPIDPEYPEERVRYILEDSGCKLVLTTQAVLERRADLFANIADLQVAVVEASRAAEYQSQTNLNVEVDPHDLAYVIYTSGSTGRPKGVMIENHNLVNFVDDDDKNHEILGYTRRAHVSLAIAALTFDFAIMEEFVPLANGMTVVLATGEQIMDPVAMGELMRNNGVDVMSCTPSYLSNMLAVPDFAAAVANLKSVDMGAEAFPPDLYARLTAVNPSIYIMNGYGPTEATISCTMQVVTDATNVTIGIPNVNVHVATVDRAGRLQPLGATGELAILGDGVGRGYVGREDLNARSFVRLLGMPAYRSGDLARIRDDGQIEYRGRMDDQVKLRGLRVELGEIESVMNSYPGVRTSVCVVAHGETDYLAAYFTAEQEVDLADFRAHLAKYLTSYMVPQAYMQLDELPLTANGKVDKKALPEVQVTAEEIVPPENETQERILAIAAEVIGVDEIGITTDLFGVGLSSIGCIRLCALLGDEFGKSVKVADVFDCGTVRELEQLISDAAEEMAYELREAYPLSQTQAGIFVECLRFPDTTAYNIPYLYKLDENVDVERLREALQKTLVAHPYLFMTVRRGDDGEILAVRNEPQMPELPVHSELPSVQDLVRPFDLTGGERLFRVELFNTADGKYLFVDTHHIVSDGESLDILFDDVERAYQGGEVEAETYTGFEYALDEEAARASERLDNAKAFYDGIFRGCGGDTLPTKDGDKAGEHIAFANVAAKGVADEVRAFCDKNGVTPNAFFTTAFGLALQSYTSAEDGAVFSTIYNGRNDSRLENSVTMLVKTLPMLFVDEPNQPVVEAIGACQQYLLSAMANDIYSFAEISNAYGIKGDILFAYQGDSADGSMLIGGHNATEIDLELSQAKAGMDIDMFMEGNKVAVDCSYDPAQYSAHTVEGLLGMALVICHELTMRATLGQVQLVTEQDEERIRSLHNTDWPVAERPAYRLVQDQAEARPDAVALVACDRTLTYGELNAQANAIAHVLVDTGVGPESMVAVLAERNSWAYVMRQAALKAGGAFLPIDPEYPEERVRYILEDSGCRLVLTTAEVLEQRAELFDQLADLKLTVVEAKQAAEGGATDNLNVDVKPENLAYTIYTSGSTGRPKGVMLTNKNLVNFVDDDEKNHEILGYTQRGHASLAIAALTFDFAIMEEFVPLANGLTVVLATGEQILDPAAIAHLMIGNNVDVMSCTPSYMSNMLDSPDFAKAVAGLASVDFGAEAFPPALFSKLREVNPNLYVMNGYGPTEATISCTMQVVDGSGDITIGIPNVNVHVATVDRAGRLQPLGATGELTILGDGVGRGYVGRDDLTTRSFIRLLGMPAYRSGDLARLRTDGQIEYRGRMDDQVKLRGLRVELGEIESVMNSYPGVRTSVCVVAHGQTDYLAAYFTADEQVDLDAFKAHLGSYLTAYMVPQAYMQLDELPLTANGKVDKKALPQISETRVDREIKQPTTELQKQILGMYQKALGFDEISVDDSFFEIGGTSLTAAKVMMAAMVANIPIVYQDIFDAPTIEGLERVVLAKQGEDSSVEEAPAEATESEQAETDLPAQPAALKYNTIDYVSEVEPGTLGNVLLTGATGFLGAHMLKELLNSTDAVVYCLVRDADVSAEERVTTNMFYYFEEDLKPQLGSRLIVLRGDITDEESLQQAAKADFQTVINCAASVKHFASLEFLKSVNTDGVRKLARMCVQKGARLIHVSTVSVAGDVLGDVRYPPTLTEDKLELGQDVESNGYVYSKYLAERIILKMVDEEGLDAKIMRVGNLMSRQLDGEFQVNFATNNFMSTLRSYVALGSFPVDEMDEGDEFSPIDEVARAIVLLSGTDSKFTVFHAYNSHTVEMGNIILAMQQCGIDIDVVEPDEFVRRLRVALADDAINGYVSPLVNYNLDDDKMRYELDSDNRFTVKALYRLGFQWSITELGYLRKAIDMMQLLGFFDMDE
ncbi:MAG: amino acid adenylation domain-containing protein [Atopobiaceae bacterium]|nr:amino acid adenylation domain-containing protein [Atopobiaceae bacterium]